MNDLISRSALLAKMKRTSRYFDVKFDIEEMPAVDAVPVVRCKDCKFRKPTFNGEDYFCTVWDADESETAYVTETDFCSYGERRSGDAEIH